MPELLYPDDLVPADAPVPEDAPPEDAPETPRDDPAREVALVRELVLRAHPDVVPELVAGDTIGALVASIEPAREAYARLAGAIAQARAAAPVPAGGGAPIAVDADRLPAAEKIRRALAASTRKG